MKIGLLAGLLSVGVLVSGARASDQAPAKAESSAQARVLKAGRYSATVTAMVCGMCAGNVERTLKAFHGVEGVKVAKGSTKVEFSVKRGAKVDLARLQQKLKAASDDMGMGADYTLKDVKAMLKGA